MTPLDKFGQFVIEHLRDGPLDRLENLLEGTMKTPALRKLQCALGELDEETVATVRGCVENVLNTALHDFLFALAESHDKDGEVAVTWDGENVAESSDGLQGEPAGKRGWVARFSRHPAS